MEQSLSRPVVTETVEYQYYILSSLFCVMLKTCGVSYKDKLMIDLHLAGLRHMKVCFCLFVFIVKYNVALTERLTACLSAQPVRVFYTFLPAL